MAMTEEQLPKIVNANDYKYVNKNNLINSNATIISNEAKTNDNDIEVLTGKILIQINEVTAKVLHPQTSIDQIIGFVNKTNEIVDSKLTNYLTVNETLHHLLLMKENITVQANQLQLQIDNIADILNQANNEIETLKKLRVTDKSDITLNFTFEEINESMEYIQTVKISVESAKAAVASLTSKVNENNYYLEQYLTQLEANTTSTKLILTQNETINNSLQQLKDKLFTVESKALNFINDSQVTINDIKFKTEDLNKQCNDYSRQLGLIQLDISNIKNDINNLSILIHTNTQKITENLEQINNIKLNINDHINAFLDLKTLVNNHTEKLNVHEEAIINVSQNLLEARKEINDNYEEINSYLTEINSKIKNNTEEILNIREVDFYNLTERINKNKKDITDITDTVNDNLITIYGNIDNIDKVLKAVVEDLAINKENDIYQFNNLRQELHNIEQTLQTIKTELIDFSSTDQSFTNEIDEIKGNIVSNTYLIQDLTNQFHTLETSVNTINLFNEHVDDINQKIQNVEVKSIKNDLGVENLKEKTINILEQIEEIKTNINNLTLSKENILLEQAVTDIDNIKQDLQQIPLINRQIEITINSINNAKDNISNIYNDLANIDRTFNNVNEQITSHQLNINNILSFIEEINKTIESMKEREEMETKALTDSIKINANNIRLITNNVENVKAEVQRNTNDINISFNNINEINNQLSILSEKINRYYFTVNGELIDDIEKQINNIKEEINNINDSINNITYINQRLENINERINNLTVNIDQLQKRQEKQIFIGVNEPVNSPMIWIDPVDKALRIKDNNMWINLNDKSKITLTQHQIVKDFIYALTTITKNDQAEGTELLDIGIKAISEQYQSLNDVINKLMIDYDSSRVPITTFLLKKCGINFDNDDNGSIFGIDMDNDLKIIREEIAADELVYPQLTYTVENKIFKIKEIEGVTFAFPDENDLTSEKIGMINYFANVILPYYLKLIKEAFNINFSIDKMIVNDVEYNVKIIPIYAGNVNKFSIIYDKEIGKGVAASITINNYDIFTELLEAIMKTNIYKFSTEQVYINEELFINKTIPKWLMDGLIMLIYGGDNEREFIINTFNNFVNYLNNYMYEKETGYVILRYLFKQVSREDF